MNCCNYMQYRHHQPYYGSHYYEPMPYHGDFYGQQLYQDYYGTTPYYHQQWPCASSSFPDYVYNPKEARIRKAMRDASRERSIAGTSPMLARPNARRAPSHGWGAPSHDDHLMMSPLGGMQPPSCSFAMSGGGDQFMGGGISAYNKLEAAAAPPPPPPPSAGSVHTNYLQSNPLAQLQQHAEMWPDYHTMRSRSSGESFMMGDVAPYSGQTPEMGPIMLDKQPTPATSPPTAAPDKEPDQDQFIPVFEQPEEAKAKNKASACQKPASKPLPDFNEAFGSTERGRFQSPPDPRLAPNKGYLDYFFSDSDLIKFDDYQM
ncbi:hypothetical protein TcasGA2_TC013996 [Tribolium castaneum]|uniref:Uncharacterized protein n=1 Tax=Tribolium castaneum TaxID=7070 RepID=D6WJ26_TRICA|nr:PREDICTED: uncharacterized protein LOC657567 isoform X2 [Tribolium castaneum]EFA03873.2 hypothetical protein TcasGA2_TC013996 [Tribolium castaneum]|eukprot:XP_976252.1 PREDICTED: uncharacterized protein LOC657567 isoform X2 [Tribolium castaneum]